jgi:DNA-binding response OmpR family regulator
VSSETDKYRILVCDDDEDIRTSLGILLAGEGYEVLSAGDGAECACLLASQGEPVHLLLLDVMMPVRDGIQTAMRLREAGHNLPIIFLSAKGEETDRILGLHAGGDDYIVKPFSPAELFARVRAALRRYSQLGGINGQEPAEKNGIYRSGGLHLDDVRKRVEVDGVEVTLTALEYNILLLLISHPDHVFSSAQIYERVWQEPAAEVSRTVSVHIRHIREKIETDPAHPRYLKVVHGLGYKVVGR